MKNYKIAVAGTGYVGLSIATLLSQHHKVTAVDIVPEKVEMINNRKSPIQDDYIEKYLAEKDLNLTATLDAKAAYSDADFVVIAAPTIAIGNPLKLSPDFPPLHTVHATFTAHGAPSNSAVQGF